MSDVARCRPTPTFPSTDDGAAGEAVRSAPVSSAREGANAKRGTCGGARRSATGRCDGHLERGRPGEPTAAGNEGGTNGSDDPVPDPGVHAPGARRDPRCAR